jgi:hypothetical protein
MELFVFIKSIVTETHQPTLDWISASLTFLTSRARGVHTSIRPGAGARTRVHDGPFAAEQHSPTALLAIDGDVVVLTGVDVPLRSNNSDGPTMDMRPPAPRTTCPPSSLFLEALQAFGGVAEDAKAVAGVSRAVLAVCEPKIELPDSFNPAV